MLGAFLGIQVIIGNGCFFLHLEGWGGGGCGAPRDSPCLRGGGFRARPGAPLAITGCGRRGWGLGWGWESRLPAALLPHRAGSTATLQIERRARPRKANPNLGRTDPGSRVTPPSPRRTHRIRKEQENPLLKTSRTFNPGDPGLVF